MMLAKIGDALINVIEIDTVAPMPLGVSGCRVTMRSGKFVDLDLTVEEVQAGIENSATVLYKSVIKEAMREAAMDAEGYDA